MVFNSTEQMTAIFPSFTSLTLKTVLAMDLRHFHLSEKKDGVTAEKELFGARFVGEQMRNGDFWAIDVKRIGGQDVCQLPKRERWQAMQEFSERGLLIVPSGFANEFAEAVAADSAIEGFVGQSWDAPFGYDIFKVKRVKTFAVTVTGKLRGSIAIGYEGHDAGKCALAGRNLELVRVGDVVEIAAMRRNASGKFREPRFIRVRYDKF
jgi:ATP-dependent DNA ligase